MDSIFIGRDGEQFGPYTRDELKSYLKAGKVLSTDLAWREGMSDWVAVDHLVLDLDVTTAPTRDPVDLPKQPVMQSVEANSSNIPGDIPDGVRGWSWGALLLTWIWAIGNRVWLGLLSLVPFVGIFVAVWLGIKGREMAWKTGKWDSVEHFNKVQKKWSQWGVGIISVAIIFAIFGGGGSSSKKESGAALPSSSPSATASSTKQSQAQSTFQPADPIESAVRQIASSPNIACMRYVDIIKNRQGSILRSNTPEEAKLYKNHILELLSDAENEGCF